MESRKRSLIKAFTWRLTGSMTVLIVSYLITGKTGQSTSIAIVHAIFSIILYYFHERAWNASKFGLSDTTK